MSKSGKVICHWTTLTSKVWWHKVIGMLQKEQKWKSFISLQLFKHITLQCRRKQQMADSGGSEKDAVANYFNTQGFERWNKIYGTTDDVNKVKCSLLFMQTSWRFASCRRDMPSNIWKPGTLCTTSCLICWVAVQLCSISWLNTFIAIIKSSAVASQESIFKKYLEGGLFWSFW